MGALLQLAAACSVMLIMSHGAVPSRAGQHDMKSSPSDCEALTSFAAGLHVDLVSGDYRYVSRAMNESWNSSRNHDCCSWQGVGCAWHQEAPLPVHPVNGGSADNAVPVLRVKSLSLQFGSFSASSAPVVLEPLCNLPFLSSLILSNFYYYKPVPVPLRIAECLGEQLPLLRVLDLSYLPLTGRLPYLHTPLLRSVNLDFCSLSGPLPTFNSPLLHYLSLASNNFSSSTDRFTLLFNLTALTHLDLSGNSISGPIPSSISRLHNLQFLSLSQNSLSGPLPNSLCELFNLIELDLSDNLLSSAEFPDHPHYCAQLKKLTRLDLSSNGFTGPFPAWIGHFPSLETLDLSINSFSSSLPDEWQNLQKLKSMSLSSGNSLNGTRLPGWVFRFPNLTTLELKAVGLQSEDVLCSTTVSMLNKTLERLDLSANNITGRDLLDCFARHSFEQVSEVFLDENPLFISLSENIQLLPAVDVLSLRACNLTGFLSSKRIFEGRSFLDLSDNHLVGKIPTNRTETIAQLYLSDNYFTGFDPYGSFRSLFDFDLSNNLLAGDVSTVLQTLGLNCTADISVFDSWSWLRLSYNELGGQIPASLAACNISKSMHGVYLDHNNLTGEIPENFAEMPELQVMQLDHNHLKGTIPASIVTEQLVHLELSYNELEGNLKNLFARSLQQSPSKLVVLGLAHNRISGSIPSFLGTFTPALCIIDISYNNLTGNIPPDLHLPSFQNGGLIHIDSTLQGAQIWVGSSTERLVIKGVERSLGYIFATFRFLDLSENHLEGSIPSEIGDLSALLQLNLSHNSLSGHIPEAFGKLAMLETLDLSFNRLQGFIPTSLSSLDKLGVFNVSYDEALQGPIPMGSQLTDNKSYIGDPLLCGLPVLQRPCDHSVEITNISNSDDGDALTSWIDEWISVPGFVLGTVVGFCSILWFRHGPPLPQPLLLRMHASK